MSHVRPFVYIAHPVGNGPDRRLNLERATAWCAWAADQGVIPIAPWIAIATHWSEDRRTEGLAIDLDTIDRCDEVWLCGPKVSPGMLLEAREAVRLEVPVFRIGSVALGKAVKEPWSE